MERGVGVKQECLNFQGPTGHSSTAVFPFYGAGSTQLYSLYIPLNVSGRHSDAA